MSKREYLKYNQTLYDYNGKLIKIGAKVVINNNYGSKPMIGIVSHFTETVKVAIKVRYYRSKTCDYYCWHYRKPDNIIILKNGHTNKHKN